MKLKKTGTTIISCLLLVCLTVVGQDAATSDAETGQELAGEKAKIAAAIESYVAAFNAKDVDKLASHWSVDGVYTSRKTEEQTVGRTAIQENLKATFEGGESPKLAVSTRSIDLISPNVALEKGTATVTHSADEVTESEYSVIYVKHNGAWLIDRVTEDEIVVEENHYDELQELEFLIGQWSMEGEKYRVEFNCQWTSKQNFISRIYKVYGEDDGVESSGIEIIGWDAKEKKVRSWLFDSDGGVVKGTWTKRNDGWSAQCVATLADGGAGSYLCILRPQEDGNYSWEKINRVLDGSLLPNIEETLLMRQ